MGKEKRRKRSQRKVILRNILYNPATNKFFSDNKDGTFGYQCSYYMDAYTVNEISCISSASLSHCIKIDTLDKLKTYADWIRVSSTQSAWRVKEIPEPKILPQLTPPKKSNIAEVHVQELEDGKFKVVALKNFLSVEELNDKYGSKAVALYGFPYMYKVSDTTIAAKSRSALLRLCIGDIISLRTFNEALTLMRSCGENLINAVKKAKEPETKPVKIFKI